MLGFGCCEAASLTASGEEKTFNRPGVVIVANDVNT
jgi:hypothetical protein